MPGISSAVLDCAIYLYQSRQDAVDGAPFGGSGFLFPLAYSKQRSVSGIHVYAVTNAHLVCGDSPASVVRLSDKEGGPVVIELDKRSWKRHPDGDDLAVCLLQLPDPNNFRLITPRFVNWRPQSSAFDEPGRVLGRDVVMVGRHIGLDGKQRNTPTLRFGNIAALPIEPIEHPASGLKQESFLVELRSLPGYSGSPVFVLPDPGERMESQSSVRRLAGVMSGEDRSAATTYELEDLLLQSQRPIRDLRDLDLLGVDWCHLAHPPERVVDKAGSDLPDEIFVRAHSGMAGVIPWWRLWDFLQASELAQEREKVEAEAERRVREDGLI